MLAALVWFVTRRFYRRRHRQSTVSNASGGISDPDAALGEKGAHLRCDLDLNPILHVCRG